MSTVSISKPEKAVAVSIKHEGEDRGHAFGPAVWLDEDGNIVANVIDSEFPNTLKVMTFNKETGEYETSDPETEFTPEWMDFREVYNMAKHFGVEVYEQ